MLKLLTIILIISISLNVYFVHSIVNDKATLQSEEAASPFTPSTLTDITQNTTSPSSSFDNIENQARENQQRLSEQAKEAYEDPASLPAEDLMLLLEELQANKQYNEMVLPLREYLKLYPNDYRAWLIEADMIYHTEPLNVAIAYYYSLLDKNIPDVERATVSSLIKVNTTNVIKQLTVDGAWELLATFLEPLIQIDPLNQRYLLALARAYGEQEQFVLMENVLAAISFNNSKAEKLRVAMYRGAEQSETETDKNEEVEDIFDDTATLSKRRVPVTGNGEQFFVRTRFGRRFYSLLLDTGASTTAIKQSILDRVPKDDREFIGYFTVQTAGGTIQAPLYKLKSIRLESIEINNVSVIVLPDENLKGRFSGLLGMNVLRAFEIRYDPTEQRMTLLER